MVRKTIALALTLILFACTQNTENATGEKTHELRLFTWSEYFDEELLRAFEEQTGAKVKADYFSSNEQMLAKLELAAKSGEPGYDLILPSDYMVRILIELGLIQELDAKKMPFLTDFDPAVKNPEYDPGLRHSVPLAFGTTGLAVNTKLLPKWKGEISWKEALGNPEYAGKVTLLDDTKETLQVALFLAGKDLGSATEADIHAAFARLKNGKKQIKAFTAETRPVIESGECALCMAYSGDVLSVAKEKPEIRFVVPSDGASAWTDNFAIPKNAPNPELAYKFMALVLSADGAKRFTERTGYRTAHLKAKALLPKSVSENPIIYPSAKDLKRFHYLVDRKELSLLIDKEWTILKSL